MKILLSIAFSALLTISNILFVHPSLYAAGITPGFGVYRNGGTVSAVSSNSGAKSCEIYSYQTDTEKCYISGLFVNRTDTITVTVTPPKGKQLASWGNSLCDNGSTTCSVKFTAYDDEDMGYTYSPLNPVLTLSYKTATPSDAITPTQSPDPKPVQQEQTDSKPQPQFDPATPISDTKLNGTDTTEQSELKFENNTPVTLSGKTSPNATVRLYIFSTPREAEVQADEKGEWTYIIEGLETGDHRVEAVAIDSDGNESDRVLLASFTIDQPTTPDMLAGQGMKQESSILTPLVISVATIILSALLITSYIIWKKMHIKRSKSDNANAGPVASDTNFPQSDQISLTQEENTKKITGSPEEPDNR